MYGDTQKPSNCIDWFDCPTGAKSLFLKFECEVSCEAAKRNSLAILETGLTHWKMSEGILTVFI